MKILESVYPLLKTFLITLLFLALLSACGPEKKTWVALGDSITYLNDHHDETGNRITKGYLTRVCELMPNLDYVNKGYNGWTAVRIADEIESLGLNKADAYTVFLGTNDWWHGKPIGTFDDYKNDSGNETFYGAYKTIIKKLTSLNTKAEIILITPMQRGDFVYIADMNNHAYGSYSEKNGQSLSAFADAIKAIGDAEGFKVADVYYESGITHENVVKYKRLKDPETGAYRNYDYPDYLNVPFNPEKDEYPYPVEAVGMTYDGLHPSDAGYEILAQMLVKLLKI